MPVVSQVLNHTLDPLTCSCCLAQRVLPVPTSLSPPLLTQDGSLPVSGRGRRHVTLLVDNSFAVWHSRKRYGGGGEFVFP